MRVGMNTKFDGTGHLESAHDEADGPGGFDVHRNAVRWMQGVPSESLPALLGLHVAWEYQRSETPPNGGYQLSLVRSYSQKVWRGANPSATASNMERQRSA